MLKPDFLFVHTATVTPLVGSSGTGKPLYGASYPIKCRIEPRNEKILDAEGEEVLARGRIYMTAGTRLALGSLIEWEGIPYSLIGIQPEFGYTENHVKGWFQ